MAVQAKLKQKDWDLIICDEAHKLSAIFFGGEIKYTKRYHLGPLLLMYVQIGLVFESEKPGQEQRSLP